MGGIGWHSDAPMPQSVHTRKHHISSNGGLRRLEQRQDHCDQRRGIVDGRQDFRQVREYDGEYVQQRFAALFLSASDGVLKTTVLQNSKCIACSPLVRSRVTDMIFLDSERRLDLRRSFLHLPLLWHRRNPSLWAA